MNSFFNMDNGIFVFLGKVFDIMMIGVIYLICCIPIITIGPATTALYYTIVKSIRKNRGYVTKEFFKSFKENFKVGTISWVIVLLIMGVLYANIQLAKGMSGNLGVVLGYIYRTTALFLAFATIYLFPVLSRFKIGVKQLFKTSFFLAIKHLPTTILLGILFAVSGVAMYLIIILPLIVPAICYYLSSFLMERVLKKYMPKEEENEDTKKDQWYLE